MLSVVKQYGRTILCCVIAALIFGMVFHIRSEEKTGLIQIAYGRAAKDMRTIDILEYRDTDAWRAAAVRTKPEILFCYTKTLPGTAVNVDAMFSAKDADGREAVVMVTDILDASGMSILYATEADKTENRRMFATEQFCFPSPGFYTLCVRAVDTENKTACAQYQFPVTCY